MIHLAVPRDFVVLIFVGWGWLGWRLDIGFWIGPGLRVCPGGRNWGAFGAVTVLALGLGVLCYLCPWWWLS